MLGFKAGERTIEALPVQLVRHVKASLKKGR